MATWSAYIAATNDDAFVALSPAYAPAEDGGQFNIDTTINDGTDRGGSGWRFLNVGLSGVDTINSAYLQVALHVGEWNNRNWSWTCEDADNPATFSSGSRPGDRTVTSAGETWFDNYNYQTWVDSTAENTYNLPGSSGAGSQSDFGAMIQEVIDRPGWAENNAIVVLESAYGDPNRVVANSVVHWLDYDNTDANQTNAPAPRLVVDYTEGIEGGPRQAAFRNHSRLDDVRSAIARQEI